MREQLIERRRAEYAAANPGWPDFAFDRCPSCGNDTVAEYGERYPVAQITGCNKCHRSWCD